MNICAFTRIMTEHGVKGGMETHLDIVAREMAKKGHDVFVITTRHPDGIKELDREGIKIYFCDKGYPGRYLGFQDISVKKYKELSHRINFDLIWSQSFGAEFLVEKLYSQERLPPLATILHGTFLWEGHNLLRKASSLWDVARSSKRVLTQFYKHYAWRRSVEKAEAVICVSRELMEFVKSRYQGIPDEKIYFIPNGFDEEKFFPCPEEGIFLRKKLGLEKNRILLYAGRLEREKGVQLIIKALKELREEFPDIKLIVVGAGPDLEFLIAEAGRSGVSKNVIFTGYVDNRELRGYYNLCDVFLLPSLRSEGFPITLAEAMACGKPMIASRIGGIPSAIDDGINGILVPPKDLRTLCQEIRGLLDNSSKAQRMSKNALERSRNEFTRENMVKRTLDVFEKCVQKKE